MSATLQFFSSFHIFLTLLLSLQIACSSSWPATLDKGQSSSVSDLDKLRKQVERFAVGEGDEKVYLQLEQLPRNDLISDLDKLKKQAAEDDSIQVKIAFLFCRLDYHYEENREMIARSLTRNSPYYKLPPDETIGFASNLIKRGDKQLLTVVMTASEWSDGALSEGIEDILYKVVMNDLDSFLRNLVSLPPSTRQAVYREIGFALTEAKDKSKLKSQLKSKSGDKDLGNVAKEMLHAIT
jgi:hypothetical protein